MVSVSKDKSHELQFISYRNDAISDDETISDDSERIT